MSRSSRRLSVLFSLLFFLFHVPAQATLPSPGGEETSNPVSLEAPAPVIGRAHLEALAEREAALATLLDFIERGEEVPLYQVILLTASMTEESEVEAAVAASIAFADSFRNAAEARSRSRREAESKAQPPPAPPIGEMGVAATEPLPAASSTASPLPPKPPAPIATERLVALGGVAAADILLETGRAKEALLIYEDIVAKKKDGEPTTHVLFQRARCLESLGRTDEAIAAFGEIARLPNPGTLAAEAAFAARHLVWKKENDAVLSKLGEGKRE
jgi:tetratricopeptide (TPR) repeat protein